MINVFLFNFASELANRTRLKELLRSPGLGRFYYPNHPVSIACGRKPEYPEEIYDCRLTAPGWRESLRSYGLRRFYNPNRPVNIVYGRKPEYPEEIYNCRQSVRELLTYVTRIWSGDRTHDLRGDRRLLWRLRHLVITVQDKLILHEKFKFPRVGSCFTVIIL